MTKTLYQQYDLTMLNQEAKTVMEGEIGYAFCLSQVSKIQEIIGKPTDIYFGYYDTKGNPILEENKKDTPDFYAIKLLDEEIELLAYKKERLKVLEDTFDRIPIVLQKELMFQNSVTAVNRTFNKIYDLLI